MNTLEGLSRTILTVREFCGRLHKIRKAFQRLSE